MGTVSVLYLRIENSANRPNPVPIDNSMLVNSPMIREITVLNAKEGKDEVVAPPSRVIYEPYDDKRCQEVQDESCKEGTEGRGQQHYIM